MPERAVLVAVDDLFFAAKIRAVAEACEVTTHLAKDREGILRAARELKPSLIIIDLHAEKFDPLLVGSELRRDDELSETEILGFFSHVKTQLQSEAKKAGFSRVMARSVFTRELARILQGGG